MARDARIDDTSRNLDVFEDLAGDEKPGPVASPDPAPGGIQKAEHQQDDESSDERLTGRGADEDGKIPDAVATPTGEDTSDGDVFTDDDDLDLGSDLEAESSSPDPTLNLPDSETGEDDLDYAGINEPISFAGNEPPIDGDLQYAGPEPSLNISSEDGEEGEDDGEDDAGESERTPSVTPDENTGVIVFDEEANQSQPADPGDDDPTDEEPQEPPVVIEPDDALGSNEEPPAGGPPLPEISALPEPPYELEASPTSAYDFAHDIFDDTDDDMDEG